MRAQVFRPVKKSKAICKKLDHRRNILFSLGVCAYRMYQSNIAVHIPNRWASRKTGRYAHASTYSHIPRAMRLPIHPLESHHDLAHVVPHILQEHELVQLERQ